VLRYSALGLTLWAAGALACGYCVEDKVASTYDHAVVSAALARKHQVAFFALDGRLAGTEQERLRIERAAGTVPGVDPGTARASPEAAALSVAFDPSVVNLGALQRSLEHKLKAQGLELLPLRIMDRPADLKPAHP
jgi:hypothetical protein